MKTSRAFTIVELLIVIVIIGILAAITIVAYNGIQTRARGAAASSALTQASKKIAVAMNDGTLSAYPANQAGFDALGISSSGVSYQYKTTTTGYCITATAGNVSYKITEIGSPATGPCLGHAGGGVQTITNLVTNPSFENNITDWTTSSATLARTTSEYQSGTASASVVASTGSANYGLISSNNVIPAQIGETYTFSVWVKSAAGANLRIVADEYNGSTYVAQGSQPFTTTGSWQRLTVSRTVSTGNQIRISVRMNGDTVARTYYVDSAIVTVGSTIYNYADGSSSGWDWTGTANNSTSTGPASS